MTLSKPEEGEMLRQGGERERREMKQCNRAAPPFAGKTTIVQQFLYGHPPEKYVPTIEEFHQGELEFDGTSVTLDIIDTSGAMEFPAQLQVNIQKGMFTLCLLGCNER